METIGVTAVVEGLSAFVGDMGKIQSSIENIGPPASILQDAFSSLMGVAGDFASWVGSVLTYTLGNLLADAIEVVVSAIGELISKTIEAGNEFQTLTLRLNGMNLNDLIKSGMDYNTATTESIRLTQEQLSWLQKLAAATPYDNTDISKTYSLARSYGFVDDEARKLTESTADFSSAMGLTGDTLERILRNFGQMKARGKITGSELRDLARGAFIPLDDVLGRVAKSMGVTTKELSAMISTKEGVDFQPFIDAFQQMVAEEPRFVGASERMARTFKAATNNVMDLATSFGGLNIVTPILDVLGGKLADFMDQFIKSDVAGQKFTSLGQRLLDASVKIGKVLSDIVASVMGLLPSSNTLAEGLVRGLEFVGTWLTNNKDAIVGKIREIWDWLMNLGKSDFFKGLLDQLQSLYNQLFNVMNVGDISGWEMLKFAILDVAAAIGGTFTSVIRTLGLDDLPAMSFQVKDLVLALLNFSAWIRDNRELLTWLLIIVGSFIVIQTVINLVWGLIAGLVAMVAVVLTVIASLGILTLLFLGVMAAINFVTNAINIAKLNMALFSIAVKLATDLIVGYFNNMKNTFTSIMTRIDTAWRNGDWAGIGWAIISGIADGIMRNVSLVTSAAQSAAMSAYNAAKSILGIKSPSVMFADIGANLMEGMAQGIADSAGVAVSAMQNAVAAVSVPAMAAPSVMAQYTSAPSAISNTYQQSNSYNLSINSSAKTEPIIQDFNMLQSLAGV